MLTLTDAFCVTRVVRVPDGLPESSAQQRVAHHARPPQGKGLVLGRTKKLWCPKSQGGGASSTASLLPRRVGENVYPVFFIEPKQVLARSSRRRLNGLVHDGKATTDRRPRSRDRTPSVPCQPDQAPFVGCAQLGDFSDLLVVQLARPSDHLHHHVAALAHDQPRRQFLAYHQRLAAKPTVAGPKPNLIAQVVNTPQLVRQDQHLGRVFMNDQPLVAVDMALNRVPQTPLARLEETVDGKRDATAHRRVWETEESRLSTLVREVVGHRQTVPVGRARARRGSSSSPAVELSAPTAEEAVA